jgi:hypothetical protein
MENGIVTRSSRLAGFAAHVQTEGPMLGAYEIGSDSGRCATARHSPDEIPVIADAHGRESAREVDAATRRNPMSEQRVEAT